MGPKSNDIFVRKGEDLERHTHGEEEDEEEEGQERGRDREGEASTGSMDSSLSSIRLSLACFSP